MGSGKLKRPFARGVRWKNGAWRYRVPRWVAAATRKRLFDGKSEVKLGADQATAARRYAEIMRDMEGGMTTIQTMGELIDRYTAEVLPQKAQATIRNQMISLQRIRPVFEHMAVDAFESHHAFRYRDIHRDRPTSANHDIEVLSHLFSKAIEWGILRNDQHPIRGLRIKFNTQGGTKRYVWDWEIEEALTVASPLLAAYVQLALSPLPLRPADILRLGPQHASDEGIIWHHSKTRHSSGKTTIYPWTDERAAAWQQALEARPKKIASLGSLFHTRQGQPYVKEDGTYSGFSSIWDRWQKKALEETRLEQKFTPMDLRAKVASDSENLEQARRRLGHTSTTTTRRHYHRRPEIAD